jgi:hypothetical protein
MERTMSYLLSERHFRRYERHVGQIVDAFPRSVSFALEGTIQQTDVLARNIRYAAKSLMQSQWATDIINMSKFLQVWDDVIVSPAIEPGRVVCGPEDSIDKAAAALEMVTPSDMPQQLLPSVVLDNPPLDLLTAVFVFHHHRYLVEPSTITTTLIGEIAKLTNKYDVGVSREGDTYTIL